VKKFDEKRFSLHNIIKTHLSEAESDSADFEHGLEVELDEKVAPRAVSNF
jgi:hypothetical protein